MTYPITPEPFSFYAICRNQVIALYHKDLHKFVNDVRILYSDLVKNYGVTIVDSNNNILKILGKPIIVNKPETNITELLSFSEEITITGNTIFRVPENYSKLISYNHPENAVFSISTSTQYHVHTEAKAYLQIGNFTPPLPTITNWTNILFKNYLTVFDADADSLSFLMKTNEQILLPKKPVSLKLLIGDQTITRQIYTNFYNDKFVYIIIHSLDILNLKKLDIDVSELLVNSDWFFYDFKMRKVQDTVSSVSSLATNFTLLTYTINDNNCYEINWEAPNSSLFRVIMSVGSTIISTSTVQDPKYVSSDVSGLDLANINFSIEAL